MISEEAQKIKSTLRRDTLDSAPIAEKRLNWEMSAQLVPLPDNITIEHLSVGDVPCMLFTPTGADDSDQVIVYIHGGGLVEGSATTSREWCSRLSLAAAQPVLSIDYRLAPEFPFPAALDDITAVCKTIQEENSFSAISGIGADSTGCVLALRALVVLRSQSITLPLSCFLLSPSIDLSFSSSSIEANADLDPLVSKEVLIHYARLYAGDHNLDSPEISPLFADLHGLPPILVHIDEHELLLDDAKRLELKIMKSGGTIRLVVTQGLWHVWPTWGDFPEARTATQEIVEHIRQSVVS